MFLRDILAVWEGGGAEGEDEKDTRGIRTLQNLKPYTLKSAIFNFNNAWQAVSQSTLENAWNPLMHGKEDEAADFGGFNAIDFREVLTAAGESGPTEDDVEQWLAEDEGDPGFELLSNKEIAEAVLTDDTKEEEEEEEEEEDREDKISLAGAREACDLLTRFIDQRGKQFTSHYENVRTFRTNIIACQYQALSQKKKLILLFVLVRLLHEARLSSLQLPHHLSLLLQGLPLSGLFFLQPRPQSLPIHLPSVQTPNDSQPPPTQPSLLSKQIVTSSEVRHLFNFAK